MYSNAQNDARTDHVQRRVGVVAGGFSRATLASSRLKLLEAQFPGKIQASNVVPTSNPTSVCADSEVELREVEELKVEEREVEPLG